MFPFTFGSWTPTLDPQDYIHSRPLLKPHFLAVLNSHWLARWKYNLASQRVTAICLLGHLRKTWLPAHSFGTAVTLCRGVATAWGCTVLGSATKTCRLVTPEGTLNPGLACLPATCRVTSVSVGDPRKHKQRLQTERMNCRAFLMYLFLFVFAIFRPGWH